MHTVNRRHLAELVDVLGTEREQLELLLFKLVEVRLLAASGETRLAVGALGVAGDVAAGLRRTEARRSLALRRLMVARGDVGTSLSLPTLAASVAEPYRTILDQHAASFQDVVEEIRRTTSAPEGRSAALIDEMVDLIEVAVCGDGSRSGGGSLDGDVAARTRGAARSAAVRAMSRPLQASLARFVRAG